MAYATNQFDEEEKPQGEAKPVSGGSAGGAVVESGGAPGQAAPAASGVGAGGQSRWTNIQSYLGANKPSDKIAQTFSQPIAGAFQNDQSTIDKTKSDLGSYKGPQEAQASLGQAMASARNAGTAGNPFDTDSSGYKQAVSDYQNSQKYAGPQGFNLSAESQNQAQALNDQKTYEQRLHDIYQGAAGGQLNLGEYNLQQQLDQDNPYLANARQNLLNQYSGLGNQVNQTNADIVNAQNAAAGKVQSNKDYLQGLQGQLADGRDAYQFNAISDLLGQTNNKQALPSSEKMPVQKGQDVLTQIFNEPHSDIYSGNSPQEKLQSMVDIINGKYGTEGMRIKAQKDYAIYQQSQNKTQNLSKAGIGVK